MLLEKSLEQPRIGGWGEPRGREVIQMAQRERGFLLPSERMERIH